MANGTVDEAIARINQLNDFFRAELLRVETNLVMILLPASLTLLSVSNLTTGGTAMLAIRWALLAFFGAYLALLFRELLGTEGKKQAIKAAQDALYKIPATDGGKPVGSFADAGRLFDNAEKSLESDRYSLPSMKLLLSMFAAIVAVIIVLFMTRS